MQKNFKKKLEKNLDKLSRGSFSPVAIVMAIVVAEEIFKFALERKNLTKNKKKF